MVRKALQIVGGALAIALFASPASAWYWGWDNDKEFSRVVAFGDSFMDSGNRFQYSDQDGPWGLTWIPCGINDWNVLAPPGVPPEVWNPDIFDGLCPAAPNDVYSNTFNFTNGRNYVQQVAAKLRVHRSAGPAWIGRNYFRRRSNYAIEGASAARSNDAIVVFQEPNLQGEFCDYDLGECGDRSAAAQVQEFLRQFNDTAPSDALYIVGFGAVDAYTLLRSLGEYPEDPESEIGARLLDYVTAVGATLHTLCHVGAETIVVANAPNLAVSPAVPDEAKELAAIISSLFKDAIEGLITNPPSACADESKTLHLLDIYDLTHRYEIGDPTLVNPVTGAPFKPGACLMPVPYGPFGDFDKPCNRYFIYDFLHPTSAAHKLIANEVLQLIGH